MAITASVDNGWNENERLLISHHYLPLRITEIRLILIVAKHEVLLGADGFAEPMPLGVLTVMAAIDGGYLPLIPPGT